MIPTTKQGGISPMQITGDDEKDGKKEN